MYTIAKEFHFSASHVLTGLPADHPCARLHGHNYVVSIHLQAEELDAVGFVVDYRELDAVKRWIDTMLDHRHLNDCIPDMNPTAENLARYIYEVFKPTIPQLMSVTVQETPKTSAFYAPSGINKSSILYRMLNVERDNPDAG